MYICYTRSKRGWFTKAAEFKFLSSTVFWPVHDKTHVNFCVVYSRACLVNSSKSSSRSRFFGMLPTKRRWLLNDIVTPSFFPFLSSKSFNWKTRRYVIVSRGTEGPWQRHSHFYIWYFLLDAHRYDSSSACPTSDNMKWPPSHGTNSGLHC